VGGAGLKRTPTIAAQYADEFNIAFQSMEHIQKSYSAVEAACVEIGRDPKSVIKSCCRTVCCGRNTSEIQTRRSRIGKDDEFMQRAGVMGSPEELVESLRQYEAIGADCVYLQVIDLADIDHLQLIASVRRVVEGR
jgi:alkanesulfonate monooxygenase